MRYLSCLTNLLHCSQLVSWFASYLSSSKRHVVGERCDAQKAMTWSERVFRVISVSQDWSKSLSFKSLYVSGRLNITVPTCNTTGTSALYRRRWSITARMYAVKALDGSCFAGM